MDNALQPFALVSSYESDTVFLNSHHISDVFQDTELKIIYKTAL